LRFAENEATLNIQSFEEDFLMAITFARLQPISLTSGSGAARIMAYTSRAAIHDPRFGTAFDYTRLSGDLVHEEILLPQGYPPELHDRDALARAIDSAELRRVRTPLNERIRKPQVGAALVVALPPDNEVTVDEAIELARRILIAARGSFRIPIHFAIHDAAIFTLGDVNRHAHGLFGLREFGPGGEAGPKLRDVLVRHRVGALHAGPADIVEGIDWPALVWELQQVLFLELGIDLVVDPAAPYPGEHFAPILYGNSTIHNEDTKRRVNSARDITHALNAQAITGNPARLINKLLRGRSLLQVDELRRLCAKFIDRESDREANVERILADQNVITLADSLASKRPRYLTSRRAQRLCVRSAEVLDAPREFAMEAVTAADHASVVAQIGNFCSQLPVTNDPPMILGRSKSDCDEAAGALESRKPVAGTIAMAISGPTALRKLGRSRDLRLRPGRLVIVPRAELIDDRELARLLLAVDRSGAHLVLGHDQSRRTGIACRRMAVHAVDRLAKTTGDLQQTSGRNTIERFLRCGLVHHAVEAMAERGYLQFMTEDGRDSNEASSFVVCDDPTRIAAVAEKIRNDRQATGIMRTPIRLERVRDSIELSIGEWIVTTQTKYAEPRLYAGRIGKIVNINESDNTIEIATDQGDIQPINPREYPWIRSAAAISIREARYINPDAKLQIELTDHRRAWSVLLLAATHGANAKLNIDPKIAHTASELVEVLQRSLPGALPHQLIRRGDPEAEIAQIISSIRNKLPDLEFFPDATPTKSTTPYPTNVSERVRHVLKSDQRGYELLYQHVGKHNPDHVANITRVLDLCSSDLTREIIRLLAEIESARKQKLDEVADAIDLPPELADHAPRQWSEFDIYNLRIDLSTMSLPGSIWGLAPRPSRKTQGTASKMDDGNAANNLQLRKASKGSDFSA
jgi:MobA/MobL family